MFSRFLNLFYPEASEATEEHTDEQICSICLDPVIGQRNCCMTECGHSFHTSCLIMTNPNRTCPNCRSDLRREQQEREHQEPEEQPEEQDRESQNRPQNNDFIVLTDVGLSDALLVANEVIQVRHYEQEYDVVFEALRNIHNIQRSQIGETPENIAIRSLTEQFMRVYCVEPGLNMEELTRIAESEQNYPFGLYNAFMTCINFRQRMQRDFIRRLRREV